MLHLAAFLTLCSPGTGQLLIAEDDNYSNWNHVFLEHAKCPSDN